MISPRTIVARYKASKNETPEALSLVDFSQFLRKIKTLTDQEREARKEHNLRTIAVQHEIEEFGELFRGLPREFDRVWSLIYSAGKNHREDPRITDLLIQLSEAQREYDQVARNLYGV